ncbi:hypothetical protein AAG570_008469 [Ranatra chinensis]|uniref:Uncharacterized protein n=1 Tax=Ranatra chinensis TaxID=642074 RepID=A0ABD0YR02_9HEMI
MYENFASPPSGEKIRDRLIPGDKTVPYDSIPPTIERHGRALEWDPQVSIDSSHSLKHQSRDRNNQSSVALSLQDGATRTDQDCRTAWKASRNEFSKKPRSNPPRITPEITTIAEDILYTSLFVNGLKH